MTPNARIAAAAAVLDQVLGGMAAEQALLRWSRASRFAGSGDRAAVRDLVFDSLRRLQSRAAWGGAMTGRGLMLGMLREQGLNPTQVFTGQGHDPAALTVEQVAAGGPPSPDQALDLPEWLLPQWTASLGDAAGPVAAAMRDRALVWLRVNARKVDTAGAQAALLAEGIATETSGVLPGALLVTENERRLSASRAYTNGLVELQDLSPQLACAALPLAAGDSVLDYCAGGGGKSLALAARADLRITAHDADPARMADLPARAARAGVRIDRTARPQGAFDLVVADVPCSGSGTWRRTPDQKWRLTQAALDRLTEVQDRILADAAGLVRPGGRLAYMTCSLLDAENDARMTAFLAAYPDFIRIRQQIFTPLNASDGFFLSLLERRE